MKCDTLRLPQSQTHKLFTLKILKTFLVRQRASKERTNVPPTSNLFSLSLLTVSLQQPNHFVSRFFFLAREHTPIVRASAGASDGPRESIMP